jgi:HPt (histidine-containing phosphotransfer) domain-containing protein
MGAFVERLARELELDAGAAAALAASFLRATRADLRELQAAARGGEAARLASLAHHIKGAAANLEVEPIRSRAEALEQQARAGGLEQVGQLLSGIEAELQRLEAEP